MSWIAAAPAVLASLAVLFVPGLALGLALGLRRLWLWALAPAFSTTLLITGSMVLPYLGLRWTPLNAGAFALVFAAVVYALYRFVLRTTLDDSAGTETGPGWITIVAWAIPGALLSVYIMLAIGAADNISQTFDNVFHLNAVAYIGDSGNASPFGIGEMAEPGSGKTGFYPLAWHALVQLTQQLAGTSSAIAINAFSVAVSATVWPLGMIILSRQLVGRSRYVSLIAGILSASFPAFPLNMLFYGVLYPYFFGIALVPVTLAVVLQLLRVTRDSEISALPGRIILLLGLLPGLSLAHPTALMTVLALSVPIVGVACFSGWGAASTTARIWRLIGLSGFGVTGFIMLDKLRPGDMWGPRTTTLDALWRTLGLALEGYGFPILTAALVFVGIIVVVRRVDRFGLTAVSMWLVGATLYFITAGLPKGVVRGVTGVWYGDAPRLAAIMPIVVIPLAAIAMMKLLDLLSTRIPSAPLGKSTAAAALVALLGVTQLASGYPRLVEYTRDLYATAEHSLLLSTDERALLSRLDEHVAPGEMIVGSPWTGTSLAFAFTGRQVVMTHILMTLHGDRSTIMDHLNEADSSASVCSAVNDLNVRWLLDFGALEVHQAEHIYSGLDGIESTDVVELVDQQGDAKLYRIVACR